MLRLSSSLASEMASQSPDLERAPMSSRLWLAVAFVLASGASPARAETSMIAVILDQAKIARLPEATATPHCRQPDDRGRDHAQEQQYDDHHRQRLRPDERDRDRRRR